MRKSRASKAPQALPPWLEERGDQVVVFVLVSPRASRNRVMGVHDERLKVQLTAPPVDGHANTELCKLVAKLLKLSKVQVEISSGATSRRKTVLVSGLSARQIRLRLSP